MKTLSRLFRGKFLAYFKKAYEEGRLGFSGKVAQWKEQQAFKALFTELSKQEWVVFCKLPLKGVEAVIDYLDLYTHRAAISNDRIGRLEGTQITFRYRDSTDQDKIKYQTLEALEFIRRFLLHILPEGFVKIRHYGILSN